MSARIAAIVLAAGRSTRMRSGRNKLTERIGGKVLVNHAVDAVLGAGAAPVIVAVGADPTVGTALGERGVRVVVSDAPDAGMGDSLALAASELTSEECDAALVCVGDMPHLRAEHVAVLMLAFRNAPARRSICVPVHGGRRGHPVLFGADHLDALRRLVGDRGARSIVERNASQVREVEVPSRAILVDVDTVEDLGRAREASS